MFRFLFFLYVIIFSISCSRNKIENNAVLSVKITGAKSNKLYIKESDWWYFTSNLIDSATIDANYSTIFKLKSDSSIHIVLYSDSSELFLDILISPNDSLNIAVSVNNKNSSEVKTEITGVGSQKNIFLKEYTEKFLHNAGYTDEYYELRDLSIHEFLSKLDSAFNYRSHLIGNFIKENYNHIDSQFITHINYLLTYEKTIKLIDYFLSNDGKYDIMVADSVFQKTIQNIKIQNDYAAENVFLYGYFIENYYNYLALRQQSIDANYFKNNSATVYKYNIAKEELKGKSRDLAIVQILKLIIDRGSEEKHFKIADSLITNFKYFYSDLKYFDYIKSYYQSKKIMFTGELAPDFTLPDINGIPFNLSDLKNKIVVIDFWGTWCNPCIKQIPYAKALQKNYEKREDIKFLYVAMEYDNLEKWKKIVNEKQIKGIHLYSEDGWNNPQLKVYNIYYAPRYIIIDKDGKIFNPNAPSPSNGLKDEIDKLLQ